MTTIALRNEYVASQQNAGRWQFYELTQIATPGVRYGFKVSPADPIPENWDYIGAWTPSQLLIGTQLNWQIHRIANVQALNPSHLTILSDPGWVTGTGDPFRVGALVNVYPSVGAYIFRWWSIVP